MCHHAICLVARQWVYWTKKRSMWNLVLNHAFFHLDMDKKYMFIVLLKCSMVDMTCLYVRKDLHVPVTYLGQCKCTEMRTKSNNTIWRVVFHWMLTEDTSLECTNMWQTMNYIRSNIFRLLSPALTVSATSFFLIKMTCFLFKGFAR